MINTSCGDFTVQREISLFQVLRKIRNAIITQMNRTPDFDRFESTRKVLDVPIVNGLCVRKIEKRYRSW